MTSELRASRSKEYVEQLRAYNNTLRYQTVDITWGEEAESRKGIIIGNLCSHARSARSAVDVTKAGARYSRASTQRNPGGRILENA